MRILITNDDGINAPGLKTLEAIGTELAGPDGECWIVAPAFEQSGVAHRISYTHPTMMAALGPRRFAIEGSPADCVLAGLHDILKETPPDIILSGVNRGNNSAENALYSGTLGAAMEGALQDIPSFALSQYYGPENISLEDPFEAAAKFGADTVRKILEVKVENNSAYPLFFNVNFPAVPAAAVKGLKITPQGRRIGTRFAITPQTSPSGRTFLWAKGGDQRAPSGAGTDAEANLAGYISVTPMRADLTAHDVLSSFKGLE